MRSAINESDTRSSEQPISMGSSAPAILNPWESRALDYSFPDLAVVEPDGTITRPRRRMTVHDPVIYPGLYAPSGFDIMSILMQVVSRPNPKVDLGAIDCSVALILCDLEIPDQPIVYVSDPFTELTGYSKDEVLGRNCRFLQTPYGRRNNDSRVIKAADKVAIHRMRQAVQNNDEIQLEVTNYKKNGDKFRNAVAIIPVRFGPDNHRYAVGFLVDV